ncbi:hypothetical protein GGR02_000133 [Anoxybacillus voinovskiensis]|uniref:RNA-binding protein KhpB N-terminal domain-containing protein n=1 Tax=Anoxybacteroides voinovskiense TaxID=230470 RepID=A0A840DQG6_9BACL|nr:FapA family protein [Anoxybacillus voinovskiensis]MBB4072387.1 hypothetical protein [Anoxybacillus voinovskiensis]GGJ58275.1 hypothetical protein GCM10008982_04250 [Anoxybacillus voinovskiensis]
MNQTIISTGRNVQEAVNAGLTLLRASYEEVTVEIIQQEQKGVLFSRVKPAVVKLTKVERQPTYKEQKKAMSVEAEKDREVNNNEGKVWVKQGKLYCKTSPSHYPTVTVGEGVQLWKNGERVTGTVVMTEKDEFDIKVKEDETTETNWKIVIDESKMCVTLYIEPGMRKTYVLNDIAPAAHLNLQAEEKIEVQQTLSYKRLLEELQNLQVVLGFKHSEIVRALNATKPGEFIIAQGIPPREGRNGWVELKFQATNQAKGPKVREDGTVDFRELKTIPTVQKGQVIVVIHPPEPGLSGMTVTNDPIPVKETKPVIVQLGKGVEMVGNTIIATETGRPIIQQKGLAIKVSVVQKFVQHGNVDLATGNIHFKGDVEVLGSVEDGMYVEADGAVVVAANVNRATVSSKQGVIVHHNVIGSTITVGENRPVIEELVQTLRSLGEQLQLFVFGLQQIITSPTFQLEDSNLYPVIKLLLERKFPEIMAIGKRYLDIQHTNRLVLEQEWNALAQGLRQTFFTLAPNDSHSLEALQQLLADIKGIIEKYQAENSESCYVELSYALNSTIYCSGDITISGQGCYNSKIHAGGLLKIDGIIRGGEVFARRGAIIKEAGSSAGVATFIAVPHDQSIEIKHAWEGTVIQIGKARYRFSQEQRWIKAVLNEAGKITFV